MSEKKDMIKSEQACPGYPRKLLFYDIQPILMEQHE